MSLTRQEYDDLIARSDEGEICFMFDPTQCKDFLLNLDNAEAVATIGNFLRFESRVVRAIAHFVEPLSILVAIVAGFVWLRWWGLLIAPGVILFWSLLKSVSSGGKQRFVGPLLFFTGGIFLAFTFRDQGVGYVIFMLSISSLYLAEMMLYALPVLFFSFLTYSDFELVNLLYDKPIDEFNREMGIPLMWHLETSQGGVPDSYPKMPSRFFLTLYCFFNKECRSKAFSGRHQPRR